MARNRSTARFIKPMECLPGETVPEGDGWTYELKLHGYRVIAVKRSGKLTSLFTPWHRPHAAGSLRCRQRNICECRIGGDRPILFQRA